MFAVIKKNEGLAKVIDAPSLKAAYDKLMYSEEDMLEPGKYQLINDQNPEESLMFEYLPMTRLGRKPSCSRTAPKSAVPTWRKNSSVHGSWMITAAGISPLCLYRMMWMPKSKEGVFYGHYAWEPVCKGH